MFSSRFLLPSLDFFAGCKVSWLRLLKDCQKNVEEYFWSSGFFLFEGHHQRIPATIAKADEKISAAGGVGLVSHALPIVTGCFAERLCLDMPTTHNNHSLPTHHCCCQRLCIAYLGSMQRAA